MTPRAYAAARALAQDPNATPAERDTARLRIAEHEAKHGRSLDPGKRPWWTLKIARKGACVWLGNCREFRRAIRALRDGAKQHEYKFEWQTVKAVQDEQVEWLWFSDQEPWQMPAAMRKECGTWQARDIEPSEAVVEWPPPRVRRLGTPKKRRGLNDGQLPGWRSTRKTSPAT